MTMHSDGRGYDTESVFDIRDQSAPETDALRSASRKLIEASEELRRRSAELRDEMMQKQSV